MVMATTMACRMRIANDTHVRRNGWKRTCVGKGHVHAAAEADTKDVVKRTPSGAAAQGAGGTLAVHGGTWNVHAKQNDTWKKRIRSHADETKQKPRARCEGRQNKRHGKKTGHHRDNDPNHVEKKNIRERTADPRNTNPYFAAWIEGERGGRPRVSDSLTTPIVQTSTYTFQNTAELIAYQVRPDPATMQPHEGKKHRC